MKKKFFIVFLVLSIFVMPLSAFADQLNDYTYYDQPIPFVSNALSIDDKISKALKIYDAPDRQMYVFTTSNVNVYISSSYKNQRCTLIPIAYSPTYYHLIRVIDGEPIESELHVQTDYHPYWPFYSHTTAINGTNYSYLLIPCYDTNGEAFDSFLNSPFQPLSGANDTFNSGLSFSQSVVNFIMDYPLIFIYVSIPFIYVVYQLTKRFLVR